MVEYYITKTVKNIGDNSGSSNSTNNNSNRQKR